MKSALGRLCSCRRAEDGIFLVLTAAAMLGILGMVAIVIDLSSLRQDRAANRLTADAVVTAAASKLGSSAGPSACTTAWEYFLANTPDEGVITQTPNCASFPISCSAATVPSTGVGVAAPYRVEIIHPVPATDPIMAPDAIGNPSQTVVPSDGDQCRRIGIRIFRGRKALFAGVLGFGSKTTQSHSVGLYTMSAGTAGALPALVTFERHDCLTVNANTGEITVENAGIHPGLIYTDSDGTGAGCNPPASAGTRFTIDAQGSGRIRALGGSGGEPPVIGYFASNGKGYSSDDVPPTSSRIIPTPLQQPERLTRVHVDRVYNCSNSMYSPSLCTVDALGVTQSDPIANLQSSYRGAGAPAGFTEYTGSCEPGALDFTNLLLGGPNWFINCTPTPTSGDTFKVKGGLVKFGAGTFVFKGGISIEAGGQLQVGTSTNDSVVFLRNGGLRSTGNQPNSFTRTFLYSDATTASPLYMGQTSTSTFNWSPPAAGDYAKLMFWTESTGLIEFSGSPPLNMFGVLMAASAPFRASGSGTIDATEVQFLVRTAETSGSSRLLLRPDPNTALEFPKAGVALIR